MSARNVETARSVSFFVPGEPVTQGSMRSFTNPKTGRTVIVHDKEKELSAWRDEITAFARHAWAKAGWETLDEPVMVTLVAYVTPPKRPRFPVPGMKPDLDKIQRAIGDALSPDQRPNKAKPWKAKPWQALKEDSRIVRWKSEKLYAHGDVRPGVFIRVTRVLNK